MKINTLIISLLMFSNVSICQVSMDAEDLIQAGLRPSTPIAPNSSQLAQEVNFSSNFTGVSPYIVPLFTLNDDIVSVPVFLSYNPNAVRVNSLASPVGFGWCINAGGVITRTVMDVADDSHETNRVGMLLPYKNNMLDGTAGPFGEVPTPDFNPITKHVGLSSYAIEALSDQGNTCKNAMIFNNLFNSNEQGDTEADVFTFNLFGKTGKFIIHNPSLSNNFTTVNPLNFEVRFIPYQNVKVEVLWENEKIFSGGGITGFVITDENFVKYTFTEIETTTTRSSGNTFQSDDFNCENDDPKDPNFYDNRLITNTAWHLTKIELPNNDNINFHYTFDDYFYYAPTQYSTRLCDSIGDVDRNNGKYTYAEVNTEVKIHGKKIRKISYKEGSINFESKGKRKDFNTTGAITKIRVINANNTPVKETDLKYKYLACSNSNVFANKPKSKDGVYLFNPLDSLPFDNTVRLLLDSIVDIDTTGLRDPVVQTFDYDTSYNGNKYPSIGSTNQDLWGYNKNLNAGLRSNQIFVYPDLIGSNKYRLFKLNGYTGPEIILHGVNREANINDIRVGLLSKINLATGGSKEYIFEPNEFLLDGNQQIKGGGIRIKKVNTFDPVTAQTLSVDFDYSGSNNPVITSGKLFKMPFFAYMELTNHISGSLGLFGQSFSNQFYESDLYNSFLVRTHYPVETLNSYDGLDVGYQYISEYQSGLGKTVNKYSVSAIYGDENDFDNSAGDSTANCNINENGYCDGLYNSSKTQYCEQWIHHQSNAATCDYTLPTSPLSALSLLNIDLTGAQINQPYCMPHAPNLNYDWNRGFLINQKVYSNSNKILKEKIITYSNFTPNGVGPKVKQCVAVKKIRNYKFDGISSEPHLNRYPCFGDFAYFYKKYNILTDIKKVVNSEKVITYENVAGSNKSISNQIDYTYKSEYPFIATESATTSKGENIITTYNYAFEPSNNLVAGTNSFDLVESIVKNNTTGTSAVKQFEYFAIPNPYNTSSLLIKLKKTTSKQANFNQDIHTAKPVVSSEITKINYLTGMPLEVKSRSGLFTSYVYQNRKLNINDSRVGDDEIAAVVTNAKEDEIAYTSFELDKELIATANNATNGVVLGNWLIIGSNALNWKFFSKDNSHTPNLNPTFYPTGDVCFILSNSCAITTVDVDNVETNTPFYGSVAIIKEGLDPNKKYIVSYWSNNSSYVVDGSLEVKKGKTIGEWTYYEHIVKGVTETMIQSRSEQFCTSMIDELRLYPQNAMMQTNTYKPMVGVTSTCDENSVITYYEYDQLSKLSTVRDQDRNIIQQNVTKFKVAQ